MRPAALAAVAMTLTLHAPDPIDWGGAEMSRPLPRPSRPWRPVPARKRGPNPQRYFGGRAARKLTRRLRMQEGRKP